MSQEESYPSELKLLLLNDNVHKSSTLVSASILINFNIQQKTKIDLKLEFFKTSGGLIL